LTDIQSFATPDLVDQWIGLARIHLLTNQPQQALRLAQQADAFWVKHDATSRWAGEAAYWLAQALQASGQSEASRAAAARSQRILRPTHTLRGIPNVGAGQPRVPSARLQS
jgi:hypothetical protein